LLLTAEFEVELHFFLQLGCNLVAMPQHPHAP
jgi:hypothetical protein